MPVWGSETRVLDYPHTQGLFERFFLEAWRSSCFATRPFFFPAFEGLAPLFLRRCHSLQIPLSVTECATDFVPFELPE